ncbi:hypothetical protein V6N13_088816 [Hibiscus sabdariffa]
MGFSNFELLRYAQLEDHDISKEQIQGGTSNWAEQVDALNNTSLVKSSTSKPAFGDQFAPPLPSLDLPELNLKAPLRKQKRYVSLAEIQGKILSIAKTKKRDRTLKKLKKQGFLLEASELEGISLTDSNLVTRQDF